MSRTEEVQLREELAVMRELKNRDEFKAISLALNQLAKEQGVSVGKVRWEASMKQAALVFCSVEKASFTSDFQKFLDLPHAEGQKLIKTYERLNEAREGNSTTSGALSSEVKPTILSPSSENDSSTIGAPTE